MNTLYLMSLDMAPSQDLFPFISLSSLSEAGGCFTYISSMGGGGGCLTMLGLVSLFFLMAPEV
jgi:hypothetical protein